MTVNEYQEKAHMFACYGDNAMYPLLGLAEECGEVSGKVAKFIRKNMGFEPATLKHDDYPSILDWSQKNAEFKEMLQKELGDVCWMIAELCTVYGFDLSTILQQNIDKLTERKNQGVIVGNGDTTEERIKNAKHERA